MVLLKRRTKILLIIFVGLTQQACVVGYLVKSSYHQQKLLRARVPIDEVLKNSSVKQEVKDKLKLAQEAKYFSESVLHLKQTSNYDSYVHLDRPYVSWIVRVSEAYNLKAHDWWFPIVGSVSYKGFFNEEEALEEANDFSSRGYDTFVRGVAAYSTLGWFSDPILSSMMRYQSHDLVELIIHESVHSTLYIKSSTDFNERLATFVARKGAILFYKEKEGSGSVTLKQMAKDEIDDQIFSQFIGEEIDKLKKWYVDNKGRVTSTTKASRLKEIQKTFLEKVKPKLKTDNYDYFAEIKLNNAKLLSYETYVQNLKDFETLYNKVGKDMGKFLEACKSLEASSDPESGLALLVK